MYKVLIVDDEMIVRVGLKSFIEWEQFHFTLCGEANNGEEALLLCEQLQPDLVLTDIRMPKMDGIAFIEEALQRWPHMKVIMLSCVNEFDTLQQALRLGVKDYFLKLSFNPDHLKGILVRVAEELKQEQRAAPTAALPQEAPRPELAVLKENYYRIAVRDQHDKLKPGTQVKLQIYGSEHLILYIRGDQRYSVQKNDPKLRGHLLKYSVINIIEEVLGREAAADVVELEDDCYMAVCAIGESWNDEIAQLLAREIQQSLLRFLNHSVSIGISSRMNCYEHFRACYNQSITALERKFYAGHGSIHFYSEAASGSAATATSPPFHSLLEENLLIEELDSFSFESVRAKVIDFIEQVRLEGSCSSSDFKTMFMELVILWFRLYKKYGGTIKDSNDQSVSPYEPIHSLETLEDMNNWFHDYSIHMEEQIRFLSKGIRSREEIEKAKRFVEKHYSQEISIVDVAQHIGLNSTYFSHLFKKENGEGFTEFLTRHRMLQAQRLLRESPRNINEISEDVGYNDAAYFRKIFRQQLQMTPTEYRARFSKLPN
jgi:two-component system response regulator YesN